MRIVVLFFLLLLGATATAAQSGGNTKPKPPAPGPPVQPVKPPPPPPANQPPKPPSAARLLIEESYRFTQALAAPAGPRPGFTSAAIGGGRADENFKHFLQWDLTLQAGNIGLKTVRYRLSTLDSLRNTINEGRWMELDSLAAGERVDLHQRENWPLFAAWQIELTWQGGQETFLAPDRGVLPIPLSALAEVPFLFCANQDFVPEGKNVTLSFALWNLGGKPAKAVVQTIHFLSDQGKEVFASEYRPELADIPAGYLKEHKLVIKNVPAGFAIARIGSATAAAGVVNSVAARLLDVAQPHADGGVLKAMVKTAPSVEFERLEVAIALKDQAGGAVKSLLLPVGRLGRGEQRELSADLAGAPTWTATETTWQAIMTVYSPAEALRDLGTLGL